MVVEWLVRRRVHQSRRRMEVQVTPDKYLPEWRELTTGTKEEKLAKMQDPKLRAAVIHANDNCDANFKVIQAGLGGNPRQLIVQWVENIEPLQKYVGKTL